MDTRGAWHMTTLAEFGEYKFPHAGLLCSSRSRGWSGFAAELRAHPAGEIPAIRPDQMEITLALADVPDGSVERRGNGQFQSTAVRKGTLWFCPIGVEEDSIRITAELPQILHLYFPQQRFDRYSEAASRTISPGSIHYAANVDDELVRQIGLRLLDELRSETSSGSLLADQLSMALFAHIVSRYASDRMKPGADRLRGALDPRRLKRVTDHIEAHLSDDLTLDQLAAIACLSPFYFARAFRDATGIPPHRYVSTRRLELARQLLASTNLSLAEIALSCRFSSQATFTRAFQRSSGLTPGKFRQSIIL